MFLLLGATLLCVRADERFAPWEDESLWNGVAGPEVGWEGYIPAPEPQVAAPSRRRSVPVDPVVPVPTPPRPKSPVGICAIWGDPHVMTFDHMHSDYYSPGEYWIVKSQTIKIQGRYLPTRMTSGLACAKILAIGGSLLKGHKIFISSTTATFDGKPILTVFNSRFSVAGVVEMQYNGVGVLLQKGRQGKALHIVHIKVFDGTPEGVQIQINRWTEESEGHYINVRITMHKQPGQDGHCGNFNGNPADDARPAVRSRLGKVGVPPGELLFRTKTPVVAANRPNINDCDPDKLESAKAICKKKERKFIPSMQCLVDVCFGGKGFADGERRRGGMDSERVEMARIKVNETAHIEEDKFLGKVNKILGQDLSRAEIVGYMLEFDEQRKTKAKKLRRLKKQCEIGERSYEDAQGALTGFYAQAEALSRKLPKKDIFPETGRRSSIKVAKQKFKLSRMTEKKLKDVMGIQAYEIVWVKEELQQIRAIKKAGHCD